jgi:UDP-2,3-diacylglucosamine hydrolase
MTDPSALFISDAHLGNRHPSAQQREDRLVGFLDRLNPAPSHLFVVGDLFDFWIEYGRLIRAEYFRVLCALQRVVARGTQVHYIAGNHDFALGPFLQRDMGISVHPRAYTGTLQGKRLYVAHGDGLIGKGVMYRVLRGALRSRVNQWFYKLLPPSGGIALGLAISRMSRRVNGGNLPEWALLEYRKAARRLLSEQHAGIVVLGHTHKADLLSGIEGVYCNTGEWMREYNYATLSGGEMSLWRTAGDSPQRIQGQAW